MNWDERKLAKYLLRELVIDLAAGVLFTSYFSTMDMAEALKGLNSEQHTFHDYGYFGVLAAEFDENGVASGEYHPKPSYYALQNLASLFAEDVKEISLPYVFLPEESKYINAMDKFDSNTEVHSFLLHDGSKALAYWQNTDLLETTMESVTTLQLLHDGTIELVDPMDGSIYSLSEDMIEQNGKAITLKHIPIKDYPLFLILKG